MKYAKRILAACYILISVLTLLPLEGCVRRDSRGEEREYYGGERHYYRDGRWYRHNAFGFSVAVSALAIGALIDSLPPSHTTVVVEGSQYYHDDRYYYKQTPRGGYIVVPEPVARHSPQGNQSNHGDRGDRGDRSDNMHNEENRGLHQK